MDTFMFRSHKNRPFSKQNLQFLIILQRAQEGFGFLFVCVCVCGHDSLGREDGIIYFHENLVISPIFLRKYIISNEKGVQDF